MESAAAAKAKTELRKRMAAVRDALPSAERSRLSGLLCLGVEREILSPMRNRLARPLIVGAYAAFRSEADPLPLVRKCWEEGDVVAAPRVAGSGMEWRLVREPDDWRPGAWGVPEPDPARTELLPSGLSIDAVLVPGLAFHRSGGRLGYGGGYYDRYFAEEAARGSTRTVWIGFAFALQLTDQPLPREPHDLALDALATDEEIIWLNRRNLDGTGGGSADAFQ